VDGVLPLTALYLSDHPSSPTSHGVGLKSSTNSLSAPVPSVCTSLMTSLFVQPPASGGGPVSTGSTTSGGGTVTSFTAVSGRASGVVPVPVADGITAPSTSVGSVGESSTTPTAHPIA
jgi:hypothetical protein